jgi:hypothetical protein
MESFAAVFAATISGHVAAENRISKNRHFNYYAFSTVYAFFIFVCHVVTPFIKLFQIIS